MEIAQTIGAMMGASWATGVNLYLTTAVLGICARMKLIALPGELSIIEHPVIIGAAIVLYMIEFVADKVPVVDHVWDMVHTFIRPAAGIILGVLAFSDLGPVAQASIGLVTGGIAASSHLTKSTTKVAANSTLVPGAGALTSVAADASVCGMMYLVFRHPIIAGILVIAFVVFAVWFLRKMFALLKKLFSRKAHQKEGLDAA